MYCIQQLRATTGRSGVGAANGVVSHGQTIPLLQLRVCYYAITRNRVWSWETRKQGGRKGSAIEGGFHIQAITTTRGRFMKVCCLWTTSHRTTTHCIRCRARSLTQCIQGAELGGAEAVVLKYCTFSSVLH